MTAFLRIKTLKTNTYRAIGHSTCRGVHQSSESCKEQRNLERPHCSFLRSEVLDEVGNDQEEQRRLNPEFRICSQSSHETHIFSCGPSLRSTCHDAASDARRGHRNGAKSKGIFTVILLFRAGSSLLREVRRADPSRRVGYSAVSFFIVQHDFILHMRMWERTMCAKCKTLQMR